MQLITDGPDIPDKLLQAHEEENVIFFCGAGISYPAGLPDFKGLVDKIYEHTGANRTLIQEDAYNKKKYDATLNLLEQDITGGRLVVRNALKEILQPNMRLKDASATHLALLQLGRNREGGILRLVTTNFDRIFEKVAKNKKISINVHAAPMLPVPKKSRWNGLVHLHGLLPEKNEDDQSPLQRLVLTSGDFGLAYLTERWAARFVSELFRNYVVCFIGYSIDDPVLRYMMDALAADRMLGETMPLAYAFGDCTPGKEDDRTIEWEAKGVTPILYQVPENTNDHSLIHNTLKAWAQLYQEGTLGRERIITEYARIHPSESTKQDDFVGRMLWALSHESGLPARRFTEFAPVPPLDWLEFFAADRYNHEDLFRFKIAPPGTVDDKLSFSLINRPVSYKNAPWMKLISDKVTSSRWDDVMSNLAPWLTRHLNDPRLIIWIVEQGGQLHDHLKWLIDDRLSNIAKLENDGNKTELDKILNNSPNAIPDEFMRTLWRLFLAGRVKSSRNHIDTFSWEKRLERDGLNVISRLELRELLAPMVKIQKSYYPEFHKVEKTRQQLNYEIVLAADTISSTIRKGNNKQWNVVLPGLLDEFQKLLLDALDLYNELDEKEQYSDRSFWDMPSISPHWQNRNFRDWTVLIELLRDSWLQIFEKAPAKANEIAKKWFKISYPTFKRLALFAASYGCITPSQWVNWLTAYNAKWLWAIDTRRETMRLLVLQGAKLHSKAKIKLETAIITGPPRDMFRDDLEEERRHYRIEHAIWLHLAKLKSGNYELGDEAATRYNDLSAKNPEWKLAKDESDEFSHWMSCTGDPENLDEDTNINAPSTQNELVKWLKQNPQEDDLFYRDNWRETCKQYPENTAFALLELAREGKWPTKRWEEAFYTWQERKDSRLLWAYLAPTLQTMPDEVFQKIVRSVSWWLEIVPKSMDRLKDIFFMLCSRILEFPYQDEVDNDSPVTKAINHPIGRITKALLNLWFKDDPQDDDRLPPKIEPFFSKLCDTKIVQFRHGRVILASRLISLFRLDRLWTQKYLIPLLDWNINADEAQAAWEGFLWSPRLYQPLLLAIKPQFFDTVHHYQNLGVHKRQYAAFLTYAALSQIDGYTTKDFQNAFNELPQEALEEAASTLSQALASSEDQREEYWTNKILPFWHNIWPKSQRIISNNIVSSLAYLCIEARNKFPESLTILFPWFKPIEDTNLVVHLLPEYKLPELFPKECLKFLGAIIGKKIWVTKELKQCLDIIIQKCPELKSNSQYIRLNELVRKHGI